MKMTKFTSALLALLCIGATTGLNGLSIHNVNHNNNNRRPLVVTHDRFLALTDDANLGPNYVPPTVNELVAAVLDPGHQDAIASGFYDTNSAQTLRQNAIDYMKDVFCLDFAGPNATVDPNTGIITLIVPKSPAPDIFLMLPYTSQNATEIRVAFDSANPKRGKNGNWYGFQYGELVVPAQSGEFCNGQTYDSNDVLAYFQYNLTNSPIPQVTRRSDFEVFTIITNFVSLNFANSQGYTDSLSKMQIIDQNGRVGFGLESIIFYKDEAGDVYSRTRFEGTWDQE